MADTLTPLRKSLDQRLSEKTNKTEGCWLWTGAVTSNGYGAMQKGRRGEGIIRPHRLACERAHGAIPEGMVVLHSCDNKLCVNPSHLSIGTYSKNIAEAYSRGLRKVSAVARIRVGDMHKKLTESDILEIRAGKASGMTGRALAVKFGVSGANISAILKRRTWTHV